MYDQDACKTECISQNVDHKNKVPLMIFKWAQFKPSNNNENVDPY